MAMGLAALYWLARTGFVNPPGPPVKAALLALFMINAPYVAGLAMRRVRGGGSWATSHSFLWLACVTVTVLLGRLVPVTGLNPFPLLAAIGVIAFLVTFAGWIIRAPMWRSAVIIAGSALGAGWAAGVVWGRIYKSPLFFEMLSVNGIVHHDGIGLAALANMLKTYGAPTVGLDGLGYMPYHWGSSWAFAQLSELLEADVLGFYQLGYAVIVIPFFLGGVLCFATEMRNAQRARLATARDSLAGTDDGTDDPDTATRNAEPDLRFSLPLLLVFAIAVIGIFPITGMDSLGVWTSNLVISESYAVAVPFALLLLGTGIVFWENGGGAHVAARRTTVADGAFCFVVLPAGILALGYLKISLMILGFLAAMYIWVRKALYRRPAFLLGGVAFAAAVAFTYSRVSLPEHREGVVPLDFLRGFVPQGWWPFFLVAHLFWSILYVVLRLHAERLKTVGDCWDAARAGRILDVEVVALIAVAGVGPGLLLHIDGGSAFYFSDVQRWLSVGLLIGGAGILVPSFPRPSRSRYILTGLVAIPFAVTLFLNATHWAARMLRANVETRRAIYAATGLGGIEGGIRSIPRLLDPRHLRAGLTASKNYPVVEELRRLGDLPVRDRRQTGLFIPQSERRYWDLLTRPGACTFAGHVAPALTGMAMLDGMPAFECQLSPYYGIAHFAGRTRPQLPSDTSSDALCRRASTSGLVRVMTVTFDDAGRMQRAVIDCVTERSTR